VLRCHSGRVKRIVVEQSPDLFLTVAEVPSFHLLSRIRFELPLVYLQDGTVRQHDLRTPHTCSSGECPTPLVKVPHDLSALALSPLTPYQFVVGGESPYVRFDIVVVEQ
jgi:WD repeat-containing protein 42A